MTHVEIQLPLYRSIARTCRRAKAAVLRLWTGNNPKPIREMSKYFWYWYRSQSKAVSLRS